MKASANNPATSEPLHKETIVLLDFGAQYSQLIARRVRSDNVYCKIMPYNAKVDTIAAQNPKGIILSGGPASVTDTDSPQCDKEIFNLGVPVLGICYGMQLMAYQLGGQLMNPNEREYGKVEINTSNSSLLKGIDSQTEVWMSHTYQVAQPPAGFEIIAHSSNCPIAAMENSAKRFFGVQFHPEVTHTLQGSIILHNFLYEICGCIGDWKISSFIDDAIAQVRNQVGNKNILLGLSGGVDSAVVASLLLKAVGNQLTCVFVDHGLLRKNEKEEVSAVFKPLMGDNLIVVDASQRFLSKLKGVTDPETKRKIIGKEFVEVFGDTARSLGNLDFLAQGTIYPDVIESGNENAAVIKSHHNVGGLPKDLPFCGIIEPMRYLFKDEVRKVGQELGLSEEMIWRQPFPGPGLAIRIIGDITQDKLHILKEADAILREEITLNGLTDIASQYFTVLTGIRSVGVMGDERSYDYTIALRVVNTTDFMTADWVKLPYDVMDKISRRIVNEVKHVNRIVYDITTKPPASIEWE